MTARGESFPQPHSTRRLTAAEFAHSYESCAAQLWTLAAAIMGERAEVDDIVQEACGIALGKLDVFERGTSFPAWMAGIVRFTALNHLRARRRRQALVELDVEQLWERGVETSAATVDARGRLLDGEDFDEAVVRALAALTPAARACLLLRTLRELEYREIAELLAIPEGTAMSHVHRARAAMRATLAQGATR